MTEPVTCDRCNQPADANRIDVSTFGDVPGSRWVWGAITCTTSGCVDEPGRLTREDRKWIRRHNRLAEEFGQAGRLLAAVAKEPER